MTRPIEVHVDIDGETRRAGTLFVHHGRGTESATFAYDNAYIASPDAYALEPALPLDGAPHQTRASARLFGSFSDCAPDRWGRTLVQREARAGSVGGAQRTITEADYLLGVRDDLRQGALRFRFENGAFLADENTGVPSVVDLPALLELADRADRDEATYAELRRLIRVGSSLGGARPKAHVVGSNGRTAIAKFPSATHDDWNVMAWEKVAFDLARAAGITVPDSELLVIEGRSVHVIDRFDRDGANRIGYVSAMTMLEANDGDRRSYLDIGAAIEEQSPTATRDLHELWRRIVFFILISNTDDHLRNHGFLHTGHAWSLAPAFDLNPNPASGTKELSCAIDASNAAATIENALGVAAYFRLESGPAERIVDAVADAVSAWEVGAARHGVSTGEIDRMRPAFAAASAI